MDKSVEDIRQHLFRQYEELRTKVNNIDITQPGEMDPTHVKIVYNRLSLLLSATAGAFTLEAISKDRAVYEAERRHDWDAVLYRFCVISGEKISPNML